MTDPRQRLLDLRAELENEGRDAADSAEVVELDQSKVGRLSRMDAMQAQAMAQASERRRATMLRRIEAALRRVDEGCYGKCLQCDERIADKRLQFDPAVTLCIDCASRSEG